MTTTLPSAVRALLERLDEISREHEEVTDTEVREAIHRALSWYFVWGRPRATLPRSYEMFSLDGDKRVARAVEEFLASAEAVSAAIPLGQARLDHLQDADWTTTSGRSYVELVGHRDSPLPPEPLPARMFEESDYRRYADEPSAGVAPRHTRAHARSKKTWPAVAERVTKPTVGLPMQTFDELLQEARGRPGAKLGFGAPADAIEGAEHALRVCFPPALREYLTRFGWLQAGHRDFFGLGPGIPPYLDLVRMTSSEREDVGCPIPHHLVPVLNDGGGNHYCVSPTGGVVFWDHTLSASQQPEQCSPDFEAWLCETALDALDG